MCGGVDPTIGSCDTCGGPRCSFCGNTPTAEGIVLATCKGATTYSRKAESKLKEIIALLDAKLTRAREVLQEVSAREANFIDFFNTGPQLSSEIIWNLPSINPPPPPFLKKNQITKKFKKTKNQCQEAASEKKLLASSENLVQK